MHRRDRHGEFAFRPPGSEDPYRWRPVWECIEERIGCDDGASFAALMEDLGRPPYGLRAGPALLAIAAFILASKDSVAVMERNSFQPELTVAHFMRLAKSPGNFALKSMRESSARKGVVRALATRLSNVGTCTATLSEVSEKLFFWFNTLPAYSLKTSSLSPVAVAVRAALRKASEPGRLFFHDLPVACGALENDVRIDVERFVGTLDEALLEIGEATPRLRSQASAAARAAFGAHDMAALRSQLQDDYEPHQMELVDYRLRTFVERAIDAHVSDDRWLDRIAGHLIGRRLDDWEDDSIDRFEFEIRVVAGNLTRWLALARTRNARSADLRSVHVVGVDGRERVVVVRRDRPNPLLRVRLGAVREALGNESCAVEVLGQLLAEYAEDHVGWHEETEMDPT